ncbi:hypothetical protein [Ahniella affigens]|uniref:hypothetical protein n=1 Tax=Ahniella affigens TaxID=2021234 RepID=UPI0011B1E992|nr:hypothetical protein [Ahniella affigens]
MTSLLATPAAQALDPVCNTYVEAANASAHQQSRQSVMETADGTRLESVVVDDVLYSKMDGKWKKLRSGFWAVEQKLVADMRSGKIALSQCRLLGRETVEGIETSVVEYTMTMSGTDPVTSKVYIGQDGLIYAQSATGMKIRYRYQGVRAPEL